ncbi:hypothetical protein XA68_12393 [Ophiocordyceps unilateralis]|uniref:Uncharacterized protein n=1 Tax=Ophiocordyceps unilateralis TaxID=268505 RepID=A0A2A9PMJ1_OPHUN|nr:hypothetical protein XA68_12393 [Ophiocordyceps unilateralis]
MPHREPQFLQLPPTPLSLFQAFLPISLVEKWVQYTNEGPEPGPEGPSRRLSRSGGSDLSTLKRPTQRPKPGLTSGQTTYNRCLPLSVRQAQFSQLI